jgi:hypothetical protein
MDPPSWLETVWAEREEVLASPLRHLLRTEPAGFPPVLAQRSGEADWLCGVGLTDAERAFAQAHGNDALLARLRAAGHGTVTDPDRGDVTV